ncbi:MAG: sulfurtransferase [Alcaligenaceae bacterium]|nr:sulfurtransferase [Alcaligenaceae bacterium]
MKTAHDLVQAAKERITEVDLQGAHDVLQQADLLIDVREPDEYRAGHVPGAVNIPRGLLEFRMSSTPEYEPRDKKIVIYCKTSGRAALAAVALHDMGYLSVHSIAGGIDAWEAAGKPVVQPSLPSFD